ncbi:MAG TPA: acetylglutamate kinase [Terriglobia bacterium]|nr:acetylglutamate kinase [Terriglobia bacterium]
MQIVIKIGGTLLEDAAGRMRMARLLGGALRGGNRVLAVHGGGKQLTCFLEKSGVKSEFLNGLRVTSAEALDGVVKVFAGTVNHSLLAALHACGVPAVGISGVDGGCLQAERLRGTNGEDWGFVGRITGANPRVWETILEGGMLPVMACIAVGNDGQIYNVNADQAAVACAIHWRADALVFLTDVDGVRDGTATIVPQLAAQDIPALLRSGAVTGGMLAKLNAVEEALAGGVPQILIRNGHRDRALEGFFSGEHEPAGNAEPGTVILSAVAVGRKP